MAASNFTISLILDFLSRRLHQSPTTTFDSRRFFHDYAVREFNLLLWLTFFAFNAFLLWELSRLFMLRSHARRISRHVSSSPSYGGGDYVLFASAGFRSDLTDKTSSPIWSQP